MPAVKTKRISTLIESQLPEFIASEYELFAKFLEKYYEAQEVQGGTLDIINNIQKYADIDYYEKNLLKQNDTLASTISSTDTDISVNDASSFPEKNGYIRIGNEIIFYSTRTNTEFLDCSRGVSGNTTLGDLYSSSNFVSTEAEDHLIGEKVYNVSNLFLYALVKNFENEYLGSFPEKYLRGEVDKRTLIKNINKFYKAKGTDSSIEFIFNTIISQDVNNKSQVYNPKDFTYKSSKSDWVSAYALKVKVISGDPTDLIGKSIVQEKTEEYGYVSAIVDNVKQEGTFDGEKIWNIILAPETVTGEFAISTKTRLEKNLSQNDGVGKRVNVFSTRGWNSTGEILIGEETIKFDDKNITQFIIEKRGDITYNHTKGTSVYKPVIISGSGVKLLTLGVVYNFDITDPQPYSYTGDTIQVSNPGFDTSDPKIIKTGTNDTRWILNNNLPIIAPPSIVSSLGQTSTDVSAIFSDDQYYYITSSGYPSYEILNGNIGNEVVKDQKLLRIIRKNATRTTEKYKTPKSEVGILLNGTRIYGYRDLDSVRFGKLEEIRVDNQGSGYAKSPFVLLDGIPGKARAILSGSVVESYAVDTKDIFPRTPTIEITSGRGASVRAIVTGDKITSLVIDSPGEYYSSPPIVRIFDLNGKGKFAEYTSIVDTDGRLTGFNKISEGSFYNQSSVRVDIIPVGSGAKATPILKEWNFNRYEKIKSDLDSENGYLFKNFNIKFEHGYGHVANPKEFRKILNDNINLSGLESTQKTHSPILGFAYDGNPIYGPFAYSNPLDPESSIVRMTSSYYLSNNRKDGPPVSEYPLGSFTNDYIYEHKSGTLDENNGRYCVTPDFPEGIYAYFLTIDENQVPKYPYFIGENFYSLPVDSNYNSDINQNDVPRTAKRFYVDGMPKNGEGVIAKIEEVKSGTVDNISVNNSSSNFSVNSKIYFENFGSEGFGAEALVNSVKGKPVEYLESYEDKVVKLTTIQNAYLFENDTLRQPSSGASGVIVGLVRNDNQIVLKNVIGTFDNTGTFSADIKTFFILLDQRSSYTKGAILSLTDGLNPAVAKGEVLNGTSRQNVVEIKVVEGDWFQFNQGEYFLQSSNFFDTSGTQAVTLTSLSDNLEPFEVNQSVALIETSEEHGLGIGDKVNVDIFPDDATKTKIYYLKKRLYQEVEFEKPSYSSVIDDTGIGRFQILNGGFDYTEGLYPNVPLTGGSGTGATAIIEVSDSGVVNSIQIQNQGSGYKKGDYLSVDDDSLLRSVFSLSTARLTIYIDHIGFAAGSTSLTVRSSNGLAEGDLLLIGDEVIEISSISGNNLTVIRSREGSLDKDHYNNQVVSLYKPKYNFDENFQISSNANSGYIASYDPETQKATLVFSYSTIKDTVENVTISTTFFDSSTPSRLVSIKTASSIDYKFEFSEDNITFVPNPNINIQEYYKYIFDTSDSSLTGTYFDISPSKNYNIITLEKLTSEVLPGTAGSFTEVKFGFGPRINSNNYTEKVGTNFTNFYYFDKNGIVNSDDSYFKIVSDPLQGEKEVIYVTPRRFVYNIKSVPLWDGSGSISYISKGQFSVGEINDVKITNLGLNYKKVPTIIGADPNQNIKATATVLFDLSVKKITGVKIDNNGSNYSKPKVVITDGDGSGVKFDIKLQSGQVSSITVTDPGFGYTYAPTIEIIESDIEAYVSSNTIGIPQSISITRNGGAFHLDKTISSKFTSKYTVSLTSINGRFKKGETVVQKINDIEVSRFIVSECRNGSNLLKVENIHGIIRENVEIIGLASRSSAIIKSIFVSSLSENITSFYDNIGYYQSDRGKIGVSNQKIIDSLFYQDYSYVIKSKTPIDQWRELIKSTTHPAGFKLFGQVDIESDASTEMPSEVPQASHFSVIQLWDPEKNKITVEKTKRVITQIYERFENNRIRTAIGSASSSDFDFGQSRAFHFTLSDPFDGYYDSDGRLQGTKTFQLLDENGNPFYPPNAKHLIITLDGILQEPEVAYTVSTGQITFAQPPLGPYQKLTGNNLSEITEYEGVKFYGRYFKFNRQENNNRYFKKIRNIYQRNGRWLDAANQIERNKEFIIEETLGYGRETYTDLDWSTKLDDYREDIGHILDAYEHDIRFGGNVKIYDFVSIFRNDTNYDYITQKLTESLDIFQYATNLVKLAIVNWNNTEYVGNWTTINSYINTDIIEDTESPACADVTSAIDSLYSNLQNILNENSVIRSLPDYIDGENKIFDLYWEDGSEVITDEDEHLFLTINAVLQRPKYSEDYPGEDSYYIDRTVVPNRVVFDSAPIWDQDFGAKNIGEPTAVEKVIGVGVGNYKRLTIDKNLVDGTRTGPFLIIDVENGRVQNIEDDEFLYVFLDGVLQRRGSKNSYTISGPNIYFHVPIKKEMNIDIRYLYGKNFGQIVKLYDFSRDQYFAKSKVTLDTVNGLDELLNYNWMKQYRGFTIQAYQIRLDGSRNVLGQISNIHVDSNILSFDCFGFECELDTSLEVVFAISGKYDTNTSVSISDYSITYERDSDGRIIIESSDYWSGTSLRKSFKKPFVDLSSNDLIKIDGEDNFRRIKTIPRKVVTKEQRLQQQVSNTMFGYVDIETYNGKAEGEGLSVIAHIENGSVIRLEWNQRSYDPITQPTAYQYYTPPILNFIPVNGEGGGARASVLVSKGQVVSVDLVDGGSGYTEPPKVEVARKFRILSERDIGVSVINIGINPYVEGSGVLSAQAILNAGGSIFDYSYIISTSVSFESVKITDKAITSEVQLVEKTGNNLDGETALPIQKFVEKVVELPLMREETTITAQVQEIISSTIISTNRQFTSTSQNVIPNNKLTNVNYYATGAYLDIDLDKHDTIVYIADTSKFSHNGYLLIGNEIVYYYRKYTDRFLSVLRGQEGTTAQFWEAGTFIRQIPNPVTVAFGGISVVESGSHVVSLDASSVSKDTSIQRQNQVITPDASISNVKNYHVTEITNDLVVDSITSTISDFRSEVKLPVKIVSYNISGLESKISGQIQSIQSQFNTKVTNTELVLSRPVTGIIDGYPSDIILMSDPIDVRIGPDVDLLDDYEIIQRDGDSIFILNSPANNYVLSSPNFIQGNVGPAIGNFNQFVYPGYADVSGITLFMVEAHFPTLTLRDLEIRKISSYTSLGEYFNLGNNSHQNSVAISNSSGTIQNSVIVQNTNYFPNSGYLFTSQGTIIQYTSKTNTSFEGCIVYRGSNTINIGDEIVPYFID